MNRIVSLVPSLTETLCDLGLQNDLVGCTTFCVHPKTLRHSVEAVGGTKNPDLARIKALKPTHLVVNLEENTAAFLAEIHQLAATENWQVIETHPVSVESAIAMVEDLGAAFEPKREDEGEGGGDGKAGRREGGAASIAQEWAREARAELAACRTNMAQLARTEVSEVTAAAKQPWHYAYFIWRDPWMVAGNQTYINAMLECVGLHNVVHTGIGPTERYPRIEPSDTRLTQAHWFFFSSEPYAFKQRHIDEFLTLSGLQPLGARKIDGELASWFGTRTLQGLRYLRAFAKELEEHARAQTLKSQDI